MPKHIATVCKGDVTPMGQQYVGRGWKQRFTCPACERSAWFHLNFLGRRSVVCNGEKFTKLQRDEVRALIPRAGD